MELNVNHKALKIKSFLGFCESIFLGANNKGDDLLVLNYHGTPKKFINNFEEQINYLKENFQIVSADFLKLYYSGNALKTNKRPLLIVFDDGIKNNLLAIEVLNKHKIKALFFVVPDFIESNNQASFYQANIRPLIEKDIEGSMEDISAMNWTDLKSIVEDGHTIGSHSKTHLLNTGMSLIESEKEIAESKKIICEKLQLQSLENFCSPNDSIYSTSKVQMSLIKKNHSFFHSTYPGKNPNNEAYFIRRVNVECYWPVNALKFAVGRFDYRRFQNQNKLFQEIAGIL